MISTPRLTKLLAKKEKINKELSEIDAKIKKEEESINTLKTYRLKKKEEVLNLDKKFEDWWFFGRCGKKLLLKPCTYNDLHEVSGVPRGEHPNDYMKDSRNYLIPVQAIKT